jgi:hypothetical protein
MVFHRVLARTGRRPVCACALALLPPQVLLPCRYFSSSDCAPKGVGTRMLSAYFARQRATAGLYLAAVMMTHVRIIHRCTRGRFASSPALWVTSSLYRPVRAMAVRKCPSCFKLFVNYVGVRFSYRDDASIFLSGPGEAEEVHSCPVSTGWFFWNIIAHPFIGEDSTSPPRWL